MSSIAASLIVFAVVFGGALLGSLLRGVLPQDHLTADTKDVVRLGMGLIATMAAIVLGMLIASAKGSYDTQSSELAQLSANAALLDRILAHCGPEAKEARDLLRGSVAHLLDEMSPKDGSGPSSLEPPSGGGERLYEVIQQLSTNDGARRSLQGEALQMAMGIGQTRWLMYEHSVNSVPMPLLVVLVLWLTVIFIGFTLFSPPNATMFVSLFVSALSVSSAILLILEMYRPFTGLIRVSSAPLRAAFEHLGR